MSSTRATKFGRVRWVWIVLLAVTVAAHIYYWYWPRARIASPNDGSLTSAVLLGSEGPQYRLWLPYPHQNLAALERAIEVSDDLKKISSQIVAFDLDVMPSFGPFRVPPAKELLLASDQDGQEILLAANVYPVIGWVLRIAGWVAGNPWLSGGEVRVGERVLEVTWVDGEWIARSSGVSLDVGAIDEVEVEVEVLAAFRLSQPWNLVPEGIYSLRSEDGALWVTSGPVTLDWTFVPSLIDSPQVAAVAVRFEEQSRSRNVTALALTVQQSASVGGPPGAVVATRGIEKRFELPGERILGVAGITPMTVAVGDWSLLAYDDPSLALGARLVPALEQLSELSADENLVAAGEVDLRQALSAVRLIDGLLKAIPLIGRTEAKRWGLVSSAMGALADFGVLSYRINESPSRVVLVLR